MHTEDSPYQFQDLSKDFKMCCDMISFECSLSLCILSLFVCLLFLYFFYCDGLSFPLLSSPAYMKL